MVGNKAPNGTTNGAVPRENHLSSSAVSDANAVVKSSAPAHLAGRTMDLTILTAVRALDALVGDVWHRRKLQRLRLAKWTRMDSVISHATDAGIFAVSSGAVMWAWFYMPERLPRAYNNWIGEAAQVDKRLIETLRKARAGEFIYGRNNGQAALLQSMCRDYGWPVQWGDPAVTIPIPCECVHMGMGPSCHKHAATRFFRAFRFAMFMYLPLQLLVKAKTPSPKAFVHACRDALRSSAFLGAFISLFYYSVCLSRTLVGPKIIPKPMVWDRGLCVAMGCVACGWSILLEAEKRRQEIAAFVAPRAAAILFPRRYDKKVISTAGISGPPTKENLVSMERTNGLCIKHRNPVCICPRKSRQGPWSSRQRHSPHPAIATLFSERSFLMIIRTSYVGVFSFIKGDDVAIFRGRYCSPSMEPLAEVIGYRVDFTEINPRMVLEGTSIHVYRI